MDELQNWFLSGNVSGPRHRHHPIRSVDLLRIAFLSLLREYLYSCFVEFDPLG